MLYKTFGIFLLGGKRPHLCEKVKTMNNIKKRKRLTTGEEAGMGGGADQQMGTRDTGLQLQVALLEPRAGAV